MNKLKILAWDPTYLSYRDTGYANDAYSDYEGVPYDVRPVAKVIADPEFVNLSEKVKRGDIPMYIGGTDIYDGGFLRCEVYTNTPWKVRLIKTENENEYYVVLNTTWKGYPKISKNGYLYYLPFEDITNKSLKTALKDLSKTVKESNIYEGENGGSDDCQMCGASFMIILVVVILFIYAMRNEQKK